MRCKIKEYEKGDKLRVAYVMWVDDTEMKIIETALKDKASEGILNFDTRAKIVDMVRSIRDQEVVK